MADEPTGTEAPMEPVTEPVVEPDPIAPAEPAEPSSAAPEPEEEDPPVRKSAKDFIIERKDRKIAKLEGQAEEPEPAATDIRTIIQEELAPLKQTFAKSKDEEELQATLAKYPDAKKIEKTVRKYMENDAYSRVPVEFIVRGLLGARDAAKAKADEEARGTRQGGHSRRPADVKTKSAWELTDAEFNKAVTDLMSGATQ